MRIQIANALHIVAVILFICVIATLLGGDQFNVVALSVSKMTTILVCSTAVGVILKRDNIKPSETSKEK